MIRSQLRNGLAAGLLLALAVPGQAGVVNPDISVIGQPFLFVTNTPGDPNRGRVQLDPGEVEFVFDAYLNPYARGTFVVSLDQDAIGLEEGYFDLLRGLPLGLALRGGKYRVGFGRLNPTHPHTYPFANRFDVLAAYLPGDESFDETGVSLARRIPIYGDASVSLALDWLQGDSFRIERSPSGDPTDPLATGGDDRGSESRPSFNGRLSGFTLLGEQSGLEFGFSATGGTNNIAAGTRTHVFGTDAKAKLWTSPRSYLVLQAELLHLQRDVAGWDSTSGYTHVREKATGGYFFADYNWATRYDAGVSYEGFQRPEDAAAFDQSVGAFAGLALLEESTVFRADWRRHLPEGADASDDFTLRVVFSMGPHKAHQF